MSRKGQQRLLSRSGCHRRRRGIAVVVCLSWLVSGPARAVDLGPGDLPTDTIASRERLRDYDEAKKFGAARVTDLGKDEPEGIRFGNFVFFPSVGTDRKSVV